MTWPMATCRCGATWASRKFEHCTGCHETFSGSWSGDKHRVGKHDTAERRCLRVEEMIAKGWRQTPQTVNVTVWHVPPKAGMPFYAGLERPSAAYSPPVAPSTQQGGPSPQIPAQRDRRWT